MLLKMTLRSGRWIAACAAPALLLLLLAAAAQAAPIVVEGESPTAGTITTTAADPTSSGGRYLLLETPDAPPPGGWYATYKVDVPTAGVYRLDVSGVVDEFAGLSVNEGPVTQIHSWRFTLGIGPTVNTLGLDAVELRTGVNTLTFTVDERRPQPAPSVYHFAIDTITVTPADVALEQTYVGDPDTNLGTYGAGESTTLWFALNAHTAVAQTIGYRVTDYFSNEVAAGTVAIPAGARIAGVQLPSLPPGSYASTAWLSTTPDVQVVGRFAHLPAQEAARGSDNRFGVDTTASWVLPSSKLRAFAAAMRDMGVGTVRDRLAWPVVESARGVYDTSRYDTFARAFRREGLSVLEDFDDEAPAWSLTETGGPVPADLEVAYDFAQHLARQANGVGGDALELWSEPETKSDRGTADQHAAYMKAAALGIKDARDRPLVAMSPIVIPGSFQSLMLQNDVVRYVDVMTFHGYGRYAPSTLIAAPPQFAINNELRRLYDAQRTPLWATEAGVSIPVPADNPFYCFTHCISSDLSSTQQADQARFHVQSSVQDLALGTDKHFWFIGIPFATPISGTASSYYGMLSNDFQPLPIYSAQAAMSSLLGKADFVRRLTGLPAGTSGYVFKNGVKAVTVVWAASPTPVEIPLPGGHLTVHDIMGARMPDVPVSGGVAQVTATLDPIYLVTDGGSALRPATPARDEWSERASAADHVVLNQQFGVDNLADVKNFRNRAAQIGYKLDPTTPMSVDLYNFGDEAQWIAVSPKAWGGWSVSPATRVVRVPGKGKGTVAFTVTSSPGVTPGVDYPLVFEGRVGGDAVSPSVGRIQLQTTEPIGAPVPLAPTIADVSPAEGATVGRDVELGGQITDVLSGIDPRGVRVEVDGAVVRSSFDAASGRLSATLRLHPGAHSIWIRAANNAHAPAEATVHVTVAG